MKITKNKKVQYKFEEKEKKILVNHWKDKNWK